MAVSRAVNEAVPRTAVTAALAERTASLCFDDLPEDVVEIARQCLLDWFGVAIGAANEPLVRILVEEVHDEGGAPQASLVPSGRRVSALQAALVNGAASHALDYDDVNEAILGHPTVTVAPGLLALAERRGASGREVIVAFVAGYEMACRAGRLLGQGHYERGYHATATTGCLASAAACARLLGLDADRTAHALGIAATQAGGLKSMFGTMGKPLHAGMAARGGLLAASLAARGFGARPDVLECPQGFAAVLGDGPRVEDALAAPPHGWHIRANLFKYHAACYLTHAAIECVLILKKQHDLTPEAVREVIIRVNPGCDTVCNIQHPATGLETKFSLRMTAAFALAGIDTSDSASYADVRCRNRDLAALRDKVRVELDPRLARTESHVSMELGTGERVEAKHDSGIPATDLVSQRQRLETKFRALVTPILGLAPASGLIGILQSVERVSDVKSLIRAACWVG